MFRKDPYSLIGTVHAWLDHTAETTGRLISWLVLLMMLITSLIVVMRYLFNTGSIALQESVTYLHGIVFLLAISYTLKNKAHVRVDILYQRFSLRTKAMIDLLGTIIFLLPFAGFVTWVCIDYVLFPGRCRKVRQNQGGCLAYLF